MPVVRLTPFRRPSFAFACLFNLVIGFGIYASTYLVPVFLGRVRDFDSLDIGTTVFVTGLAQIAGTLIAARLSQVIDPRLMIVPGLCLFALSLWLLSAITPDWGFAQLLLPQLVRGVSVMLCIVPSVNLALGGVPPAELRAASGLFNLMRNLGGAIGIAMVNVWLTDQARLHTLRLSEALGVQGRIAGETLTALAARFGAVTSDPAHAMLMARGEFAAVVSRQALTLGFADVFRLMALMFLAALILVPFCRPARAAVAADAH
jgi:DHA2 family multidrug resistance protein